MNDSLFSFALSTFIILIVVVDPVLLIPTFAVLSRNMTHSERQREAIKGVLIAAIILFVFVFVGNHLLRLLGITLPAFRIAGGVLLFLLAIDMVFARESGLRAPTAGEQREAEEKEEISVFPLAFPLIAGPGAITTALLLTTESQGDGRRFTIVLLLVALVMALTLVALLLAMRLMQFFGESGVNVVTRIFGLVLSALSIQYILDGLRVSLFQ